MPNFSKLATDATSPPNQPTRIPATRMDEEDDIMDNTFGDSLASLSDSFSEMPSEEFLEIIDDHQQSDWYRRRVQRRRFAVAALIVAAVLSAALIVRRTRGGQNGGIGSAAPSSPPATATSAAASWEDTCSHESVSQQAGRKECVYKCRGYACCALHPDEAGSCAASKSADCARFWDLCAEVGVADASAAAVGSSGGAIPPAAPGDIMDLCSIGAISTADGWDACKQACKPGGCCTVDDPTKSCVEGNEAVCLDYQICDLLTIGSEEKDFVAVADICENANREKEKFDICSQICKEHMCCFDMLGGGCKDIAEYECLAYEPCSILVVDEAQAIVQSLVTEGIQAPDP